MEHDVRSTIREASLKLFERISYAKTTVSDIAREAGIGKGTVYLHYKTKEEILADIFDSLITCNIQNSSEFYLSSDHSFTEKLIEFVRYLTDTFFEMKNMLVGSFENIKSDLIKDVFSGFNMHRHRIISFLVAMVHEGIKEVNGLSDEELYTKAGDFFDYLIARATLYVLETDWNNREAVKKKLEEHAVILFEALVVPVTKGN